MTPPPEPREGDFSAAGLATRLLPWVPWDGGITDLPPAALEALRGARTSGAFVTSWVWLPGAQSHVRLLWQGENYTAQVRCYGAQGQQGDASFETFGVPGEGKEDDHADALEYALLRAWNAALEQMERRNSGRTLN